MTQLSACSDREWRQDLRQQIKSVTAKRGLNASQTEAVALAMVSSVTLWQVLMPEPPSEMLSQQGWTRWTTVP